MARASVPSVDSQSPGLTFRSPVDELIPPASPSDLPSLEPTSDDPWTSSPPADEGSPSVSDEPSDEPSEASAAPRTSSRASSASRAANEATTRLVEGTMRGLVLQAGALANGYLAPPEEAAHGLYLTDEDDAAAIGEPLAGIVARRVPDVPGAGNPDVADAIAAAVGLLVFGLKQLTLKLELRKARRAAELAPSVPVDADVPDTPYAAG